MRLGRVDNRRDYVWLVAPTERSKRRSNFFEGWTENGQQQVHDQQQEPRPSPDADTHHTGNPSVSRDNPARQDAVPRTNGQTPDARIHTLTRGTWAR